MKSPEKVEAAKPALIVRPEQAPRIRVEHSGADGRDSCAG